MNKIKAIVTKDTPDMLNPDDGFKAGDEVEVIDWKGDWRVVTHNNDGCYHYIHKSRLKEVSK